MAPFESDALHRMLHPRSIAMVGASNSLLKTGGRRLRSLLAAPFAGEIYPINPGSDRVQGATAYPDMRSVPAPVDLAVIAVPAAALEQVIDDGIRAGVAGFICITAGLGEVNKAGMAAQAALARRIRAAGARLVGPNCNGVFVASSGLNCTPVPAITPGHIAVISQSGNIGTAFMHMSRRARIGLSAVMTIGNAEDVSAAELLAELDRDPMTHVVCLYLEGLGRGGGEALLEVGLRMRGRKPIIAVKAGRTAAGQRAAASHTGALATDDSATTALFDAAGIIRVESIDEAFDVAMSVCGGLLPAEADGVVILGDSGGPASLCADALARLGVTLPELSPAARSAVGELLPPFASLSNPIDFTGVAESNPMTLASVAETCLRDPQVGVILFVGHFGGYGLATGGGATADELDAGRRLAELARETGKRIVIQSIYARDDLPMLVNLTDQGIPCYETIRAACTAVWGLVAASTGRRPRSQPLWGAAAPGASGVRTASILSEPDGRRLLSELGLLIPPWRVASTRAQAADAFTELGADAVVGKIVSSAITHKSDVGGVVLDIRSAAQARAAFKRLTGLRMPGGAPVAGIMLTPMLAGEIEMAVGYLKDDNLGPLVVIGFGGTQIELNRDVAIRPARVVHDGDRNEIMTMLHDLRGWPLLAGYRGRPTMELSPVVDAARILARLPKSAPGILEVDLNPVIVGAAAGGVADVRVLIEMG